MVFLSGFTPIGVGTLRANWYKNCASFKEKVEQTLTILRKMVSVSVSVGPCTSFSSHSLYRKTEMGRIPPRVGQCVQLHTTCLDWVQPFYAAFWKGTRPPCWDSGSFTVCLEKSREAFSKGSTTVESKPWSEDVWPFHQCWWFSLSTKMEYKGGTTYRMPESLLSLLLQLHLLRMEDHSWCSEQMVWDL